MTKKQYEVTIDFTVFRVNDDAPRPLKAGLGFFAFEPLDDPVVLELDIERCYSDRAAFGAHTTRT